MQRFRVVTFNAADFAEDTDFERFVLDRLGTHRVRPAEPGSVHEVRPGGGTITLKVGAVIAGTGLRDELRQSLHPLGFAAAYKVLDMLVEHVLRANRAPTRELRFKEKQRALANRPATLPVPLGGRPDLWDRLARVYVEFQDARHAVTHRRAQASASGALEVYDDARRLTDTITSPEIHAFTAAVHAAAELVIDASVDSRRASTAAWYLNALQARHGLAVLPATDPNAGQRVLVMDLNALDDGLLRWDVALARQTIEGQAPSVWDLRLRAEERVFVGRWDDVPDQSAATFDFHPASPPEWLSEEVAA